VGSSSPLEGVGGTGLGARGGGGTPPGWDTACAMAGRLNTSPSLCLSCCLELSVFQLSALFSSGLQSQRSVTAWIRSKRNRQQPAVAQTQYKLIPRLTQNNAGGVGRTQWMCDGVTPLEMMNATDRLKLAKVQSRILCLPSPTLYRPCPLNQRAKLQATTATFS
jgi:hypothetical protein